MPILKFSTNENGIILDGFRIEDITHDKRTSMLNKQEFIRDEYKIDKNVYLALNDIFFKMAKIFNPTAGSINAMTIKEGNDHIIIVPSRSYVFWNGRSVEPVEYKILQKETDIMKLLNVFA
jgi:hypothetical protein